MIPGTNGTPNSLSEISKTAAYNGYYSIGIAYSNKTPIEYLIGANPNEYTTEYILEEYLTGQDLSPKVNINRTNSFENRIIKMILYLDAQYPAENWKRFLTVTNEIEWEKLIVAGHSQGSDHAILMAKKRKLFRVGLIGGPGSFRLANGKYPVRAAKSATPASSIYGFNHTADAVRRWADVKRAWAAMSIPGIPNSVDNFRVSDNSHQLTTSYTEFADPHNGIVKDAGAPKAKSGKPLYRPVWEYMLFPK
ncbi:MAG: hypothetical protein EOP47_29220 [Sphingobacteriaceae bacterium]|nr:MAG: hypothetical protein EOP47_29220 [Sphingobacteriaceae bacterium]